jgi:hypothetical protein
MAEAKAPSKAMAPCDEYVRNFPALSSGDLETSVSGIREYVDDEATCAIKWYTRKSRGKRRGSQRIRYFAIGPGGVAGLWPIIDSVWPKNFRLPILSEGPDLMPSL